LRAIVGTGERGKEGKEREERTHVFLMYDPTPTAPTSNAKKGEEKLFPFFIVCGEGGKAKRKGEKKKRRYNLPSKRKKGEKGGGGAGGEAGKGLLAAVCRIFIHEETQGSWERKEGEEKKKGLNPPTQMVDISHLVVFLGGDRKKEGKKKGKRGEGRE